VFLVVQIRGKERKTVLLSKGGRLRYLHQLGEIVVERAEEKPSEAGALCYRRDLEGLHV